MANDWESYLADEGLQSEALALQPHEARFPYEWAGKDSLVRRLTEGAKAESQGLDFENALGWAYVAWRRLAPFQRDQVAVERGLVAAALARIDEYEKRVGRILNVAASSTNTFTTPHVIWEGATPPLAVVVFASTPGPRLIDILSADAVQRDVHAGVGPYATDGGFPVIAAPRLTFSPLRSVAATPVASAGTATGSQTTLQSGVQVFGQTPAGILTPGSLGMFVERPGQQGPSFVGARHGLGPAGRRVLDANGNVIATVAQDDPILDVCVADLVSPWSVDYRLPTVNLIPGAPLMPYVNMPVQMFGAKSLHQTGYVVTTNFTAPAQPGASIGNTILSSIQATGGDSGALLCSGYHAQPGLPAPYLSSAPPAVQDVYTCAALGVLQGRANQGVGAIQGPVVFTAMYDVASALNVDLLVR
jgi:hypothetical protein